MKYETLTPEQRQNISDMAAIANVADSVAELADNIGVTIEHLLPVIEGHANRKLKELEAVRLHNGIVYSKAIVNKMRDWVKDYEITPIEKFTDLQVITEVETYYPGKLKQFLQDYSI